LIYDTDSRSLDANKAYNRVYNIGEKLIGLGVPIIQKKIDSTFRGNIGAETQALIDLGEYDIALIILGNPSLGKQTINGIHYINNKELAKSEFAVDSYIINKTSNIANLVESQVYERVRVINTKVLGKNKYKRKEKIDQLI